MTVAKVIKELFSVESVVPKEQLVLDVPESSLLQIKIYDTVFTVNIADRLLDIQKGLQRITVNIDDISYFSIHTTAKMHLDTSHFKVYDFTLDTSREREVVK